MSGNQGSYLAVKPDSTLTKQNQRNSVTWNSTASKANLKTDTLNFALDDIAKEGKRREEEKKDSLTANSVVTADADGLSDKEDKLKDKKLEKRADDSISFRSAYKNAAVQKPQAAQAYDYLNMDRAFGVNLNHKYNYRVVDAQNNPVPFAKS